MSKTMVPARWVPELASHLDATYIDHVRPPCVTNDPKCITGDPALLYKGIAQMATPLYTF